ncbi:MAG: MgtC/SapB family protein [Anaerolineae bacterium]
MAGVADLGPALRLVIATSLGSVIGLERELTGQQAGLRTHALVALGSALFTVIGLGYVQPPLSGSIPAGDPVRIVGALVAGIGFLAGGAILRSGGVVQGLTTAASLWATAAIGLAVGSGFELLASFGTLLVLVVLRGFDWLKERAGLARHD